MGCSREICTMSDESSWKPHDNSHKTAAYYAKRQRADPCFKENEMVMACLNDYGYDRSKCEDYFTNYRNCKKFWGWIKTDREKKGIKPAMPTPEEREQVRQEYLPKLRGQMPSS